MERQLTLPKELFTELFDALFCTDDVEYVSLELGLCAFVVGGYEIVCVDLLDGEYDGDKFLVSVSCDGVAKRLESTFGSIHELLGALGEVSNDTNKLRAILQVAKLNYQKAMKAKFDGWDPAGDESLQEALELDDITYARFINSTY